MGERVYLGVTGVGEHNGRFEIFIYDPTLSNALIIWPAFLHNVEIYLSKVIKTNQTSH